MERQSGRKIEVMERGSSRKKWSEKKEKEREKEKEKEKEREREREEKRGEGQGEGGLGCVGDCWRRKEGMQWLSGTG